MELKLEKGKYYLVEFQSDNRYVFRLRELKGTQVFATYAGVDTFNVVNKVRHMYSESNYPTREALPHEIQWLHDCLRDNEKHPFPVVAPDYVVDNFMIF